MITAAQAKAIAERYQRAVELVESGRVYPLYGRDGEYVVLNGAGLAYWVQLAGEETYCDCPDFRYRADKVGCCKHVLAAQLYAERHGTGEPAPQSQAEPERDDDDFPVAWCQQCGVAIDSGELCSECSEKARELFRELVG